MVSALTIGKLAKAGGVNIQTVRYYERGKLLRPKAKRPSGYRLYDAESLSPLHFIKNAQALGFTLHEVGELLNLRANSIALCRDVQRKAQAKAQGDSGARSCLTGPNSDLQAWEANRSMPEFEEFGEPPLSRLVRTSGNTAFLIRRRTE